MPDALNPEAIATLRKLAKSSCGAPWNKDFTHSLLRYGRKNFDFDWDNAEDKSDCTPDDYDANFILLAQRLVPALLDRVEKLERVAAASRSRCCGKRGCPKCGALQDALRALDDKAVSDG